MFESGAVVGLAFLEWGVLEREEIIVAKIFDEGDMAADVVVEDVGDIEFGAFEKLGDGEEIGIIRALEGVVDADEAGMVVGLNPDDGATGGSFLDGLHEDPVCRGKMEVGSDGSEQGIIRHRTKAEVFLKVGVLVRAGYWGSAVNDAVCQLRIPQNLRSGPENGVCD